MTNAYPTLTFHWMDIEVLIRPKYAVYVFPEATTPERKNISRESEAFGWSGFYKLATVQDSDHQSPPGWAGRARQKRRRVDDHPSVQKPGFDPYNGVRHWDNFHPSWIVCHLALVTATPHLVCMTLRLAFSVYLSPTRQKYGRLCSKSI
ncbi:hypothetical protein MAP00_002885 [Monascus purpureus]|nr:hypothetical protein MAP00_002885 [Monascus purpureus]